MAQTQTRCYISFISSSNNPLSNLSNVSIANALRNIGNMFQGLGIGAHSSITEVNSGATTATNTVTLSSFVASDTVTVAGVVLTGVANTPTSVHFVIGASDTATAVNLAACINANTTLSPLVSATASSNTVILNSIIPGTIGNFLTLAISAHGSVTGAHFASGANGTVTKLVKGIATF